MTRSDFVYVQLQQNYTRILTVMSQGMWIKQQNNKATHCVANTQERLPKKQGFSDGIIIFVDHDRDPVQKVK